MFLQKRLNLSCKSKIFTQLLRMSTVKPTSEKESCGCESAGATYQILDSEQINERMTSLKPYWTLSEDFKYISRHFACKNWKSAIDVVNAISEIAERKDMQHHPDIFLTSYRNLEVKMTTNSVNALTDFDFRLAREIDQIPVEYSPKWLKSHPEEAKKSNGVDGSNSTESISKETA